MASTYYPPTPGKLNAAGEEIGPCVEPCEHIDCAQMREDAEKPCPLCGKPIGWDGRVYFGNNGIIKHALCWEEEATK